MAKNFGELRAKMPSEAQTRSAARADATLAEIPRPPSAISAEWEREAEYHLAAYDCGEVQAIDAEDVFANARRPARRQ